MTNNEILALLERAHEETFLTSIETLTSAQMEYKKSNFYKLTKIPIFTLYEKYGKYLEGYKTITDEINKGIENLDIDSIIEKLNFFIEKIEKDENISKVLEKITDFFNSEQMEKYVKNIEEKFKQLKGDVE